MEQLIMRWKNDGIAPREPKLPEGIGIKTLPEMQNGVEDWLDVIQFLEENPVRLS